MPTIREVADLAGVAVGTVSHVVNGSVPVSEALRRKVQDAIRELDYHPNHVARSLKTSKTPRRSRMNGSACWAIHSRSGILDIGSHGICSKSAYSF
jgi:DNA-binding LacI/PurR family transcriptional regulator